MTHRAHKPIAAALAALAVVLAPAAAALPDKNFSLEQAQAVYARASADPQVLRYAPATLEKAAKTLRHAEHAWQDEQDPNQTRYLSDLAKQQVAQAWAQTQRARTAEERRRQRSTRHPTRLQRGRPAAEQADVAALELRAVQADIARLTRQLDAYQARETARGLILSLGDVRFAADSATVEPRTLGDLQPLLRFLDAHPDYRVVIEGYTDSTGSCRNNQQLSQARAMAVADYLVGQGVSPGRVQPVGLGEEYPAASNRDAAGRRQNRRVELVVLAKDESYVPPTAAPGV
jgi:outer membrane protein OmpA-like peptidoglycan-associated protein